METDESKNLLCAIMRKLGLSSISFICFFYLFFHLFPPSISRFYLLSLRFLSVSLSFPFLSSIVDPIILHTPLTPSFIPTSPYATSPFLPLLPVPNPSKPRMTMQISVPSNVGIVDGPLRKLQINVVWESELAWTPLKPLSHCQPSQSLPPLIPSGSIDCPWPEESPSFPVQFDFGDYYPPQEWELLLSLYCCYRCTSAGYALSATQQSTWIHFQLQIQANHAIQLQNTSHATFLEAAEVLPAPETVS